MAVEQTPDGPLHGPWMGIDPWHLELDAALMTGDDDAVTRLLAYREAHLWCLEMLEPCSRCGDMIHPEDGCPTCSRDR